MEFADATLLQSWAGSFISALTPRPDAASVVALSGDLGAGKTTFAQAAARALGVEEPVTSPTFVIEKIYELHGKPFRHLIHVDAYRLKNAHELEALGWGEIASDPCNLILIEWPERVPELIPEGATRIRFDIQGDGRIITVNGEGKS